MLDIQMIVSAPCSWHNADRTGRPRGVRTNNEPPSGDWADVAGHHPLLQKPDLGRLGPIFPGHAVSVGSSDFCMPPRGAGEVSEAMRVARTAVALGIGRFRISSSFPSRAGGKERDLNVTRIERTPMSLTRGRTFVGERNPAATWGIGAPACEVSSSEPRSFCARAPRTRWRLNGPSAALASEPVHPHPGGSLQPGNSIVSGTGKDR